MKSIRRVYCIALCGSGMSALAGLLKQKGFEVRGSDIACYSPVRELLEQLQISYCLEYSVEDLKAFDPDYVVIGNFVRPENEQANYVIENAIPYGSMASTLEDFFLGSTENAVVVGTHGKSTTSSCLAHLLAQAGQEPSFFLGAIPEDFGRSFQWSRGKHFVLEGDEYDSAFFDKESKFLHYRPHWVIWTSMEFDHADIFPSMQRIEEMFLKLIDLLPSNGGLLYCRDWDPIHQLLKDSRLAKDPKFWLRSYGFHSEADYRIEDCEVSEEGLQWKVQGRTYQARHYGRYNAQNLTAAVLLAEKLGISSEQCQRALKSFKGLKRRQEVLAQSGGHVLISDFAHHPTAVKEVIEALRLRYPNKELVVYFEPRSNTTRRKIFQKEFEDAFSGADVVFLPPIYQAEEIASSDRLDIPQLIRALENRGLDAKGPLSTEQMIEQTRAYLQKPECVFAVLSNGNFNGLHQSLISLVQSQ